MRVFVVSALQTQVEVYLPIADVRMDRNIGQALTQVMQNMAYLNEEKTNFVVENGNMNVSGELEWEFQRNTLMHEHAGLTGVRGLCSQLTIQP